MAIVTKELFGQIGDSEIFQFTLSNNTGISIKILNYGCIIRELLVPDREGNTENIVLGFDTLEDYIENPAYFGAVIGRYANRIEDGKFTLEETEYELSKNNNGLTLHGGFQGFDKQIWIPKAIENGIWLEHTSPDLSEGFPGNLLTKVVYTLKETELSIEYEAMTDKPTFINFTEHSYFNLSGNVKRSILDHHVQINADFFTPINERAIPTGEIRSVEGSPFDFRTPTVVGERIECEDTQLEIGGGIDHNFVLENNEEVKLTARLEDRITGRVLEVYTDQPGVHLYTGNFIGRMTGIQGVEYYPRCGLCFETQHFPNSPNTPSFPSTRLDPEELFSSTTIFKFTTN